MAVNYPYPPPAMHHGALVPANNYYPSMAPNYAYPPPAMAMPMPGAANYPYPLQGTTMPRPGAPFVVGPQYCSPNEVELFITKIIGIQNGNFQVADAGGVVYFNLREALLSIRNRHILLDSFGNPIVTLLRQMVSMHDRWEAYRGDSDAPQNLMFVVKRSSFVQVIKTKLDVFLKPGNVEEKVPDFKVKWGLRKRSCVVYAADGITVLAQMKNKHTLESIMIGKKTFRVTIQPNIDFAFIVAVIVVLNEINFGDAE